MVFEVRSTDKTKTSPDTTTITMDFVLTYLDAAAKYYELMDVANWTVENDPTRTPIDRLCQSLSNRGLLTGFWDITDHYVANEIDVDRKLSHPLTTCTMSNDTFRNWRHATGFGADYKVFSDLKVTNYDPPLVFYCDPTVGPL